MVCSIRLTDKWIDDRGNMVYGEPITGEELQAGKALLKSGEVSLELLDAKVEEFLTALMLTMPSCLNKTIQSLRKHKLQHWDKNKESNRSWLAGNMMTEAKLGFRAFNEGPRNNREIDFAKLRQRLANGEKWNDEFINSMIPK